jgi:LPS-assembly lipoprotein
MPRLGLALLALALGGCGFTPLYSSVGDEGYGELLDDVTIRPVQGPEAARLEVEEALGSVLPASPKGERYTVEVSLQEQRRGVAVTLDNNTRRFDYRLLATILYTDNETGEKRRQNLQSVVSYGVVSSQYATLVGQEDAVRRASIALARKIETDLLLYVRGRAPEGSEPDIFRNDERRDPLRQLDNDVREPAIGEGT